MSANVIAQPLTYPSSFRPPSTTQGVINAVAAYTKYTVSTSSILAVTGSNIPAVEDQDKIWFQTDPVGRPIKVNIYYNGNWRQFYTGKPYEVALFVGFWGSFFDASGLGMVGLGWDGWAISNGANGTVNLTNKFIIPGYRCDGVGLWVTNVLGTDTYHGGSTSIVIQPWNLPPLSVTLFASNHFAGGNNSFGLVPSGGDQGTNTYNVTGTTGQQSPITILPPFIAVGYAQFVGYTT